MSTLEAVRTGALPAGRREKIGFLAAAVAPDDMAPPQMAVRAARTALDRAGTAGGDLALVLHSSIWFQGVDMWPTASYVSDQAGARYTPAFDLGQRSNGGMGSLELAAGFLTGAGGGTALLTTADRVRPPRIDRWNTLAVSVYGDGGTAVVLSTDGGVAAVRATCTVADNSLELLARGNEPFSPCPPDPREKLDLEGRAVVSVASVMPDAVKRLVSVLTGARDSVLEEAGVGMDDIATVVSPATRRGQGHGELHHLLGVPDERTTWHFGRYTGHLTCGDQFAGLTHLIEAREVSAGDLVLMYGGGVGYSVTAAVIEVLAVPAWRPSAQEWPCEPTVPVSG
ncbi:MAG TPA: ketoacyl-ACP synthase III family protein [Streptosporangiaceae bacterium]|nr:ketoacyl-ACP synthase III family protein [Streptosporangiaceae bacterium]